MTADFKCKGRDLLDNFRHYSRTPASSDWHSARRRHRSRTRTLETHLVLDRLLRQGRDRVEWPATSTQFVVPTSTSRSYWMTADRSAGAGEANFGQRQAHRGAADQKSEIAPVVELHGRRTGRRSWTFMWRYPGIGAAESCGWKEIEVSPWPSEDEMNTGVADSDVPKRDGSSGTTPACNAETAAGHETRDLRARQGSHQTRGTPQGIDIAARYIDGTVIAA